MKGLIWLTVVRELHLHTGRRGTGIKEGKTHQGQYLFYAGLRSQRHRLPRTFQIHYKTKQICETLKLYIRSHVSLTGRLTGKK
jgi:hypothetical protein